MATVLLNGQTTWSLTRDQDGHRTYTIKFKVAGLSTDGPFTVLNTPGLPQPGDWWLVDADADLWALCWPTARVTPVIEGEPNQLWEVELTFSTRPLNRCHDESVEDPLLVPAKVSGQFVKYTEEAATNRFGAVITNSAWERLTGPQVEFDRNRPSVKIEQNVPSLDLALVASMVDTVNAFPLWGLPRRCIKLSNFSWERNYHGQCYVYYTRTLEFDINYETFDRDILDEGTKVLNGHWDNEGFWQLDPINDELPNPSHPGHFIKAVDRAGNPMHIILNGGGLPADSIVGVTGPHYVCIFEGSIGQPVTNGVHWQKIVGPPLGVEWSVLDSEGASIQYERGNLVYRIPPTSQGLLYFLALAQIPPDPPPPPPEVNGDWFELGSGLNDKGAWSPTQRYEVGDIVVPILSRPTSAARIHVEKYAESDFLLLGIPIEF